MELNKVILYNASLKRRDFYYRLCAGFDPACGAVRLRQLVIIT